MSERHPGIGEQLQHYDRIREDAALAKEVDAEARAGHENEIAHLRAINAELLEACEAAYKLARGRHSTLTYWPKSVCDQLAAAIAAAKEGR